MTGLVPPPGAHGDDAARVAHSLGLDPDDVLDLATSLNPVAPDLRLLVASRLDSFRRYPDATRATALLAETVGVPAEQLLLTNGGSEAIALVAAELPEGEIHEPEFSLYRRHLSVVAAGGPRWRSNPNNPTGRLVDPDESAAVFDEAFYPLATGEWTRGDIDHGSIVVGSLTKLFACPSIRLGYVVARDEELVARLAERQPRWSVSGIALSLVPDLLALLELGAWQRAVAGLRTELVAVLRSHGFEPDPSDANFLLVRQAAGLRERLAPFGVVVRDCASFGMAGAARIAVPSSAGLERLDRALAGHVTESRSRTRLPASGTSRGFTGLTGALLVCGTSSDAGKSQIVTGLCRVLARRGIRVAPFKAQNMSLNSFATPSGHEIGRAQGIQAIAAGAEPEAAMNPVLLKPTGSRTSQVVVLGEPLGEFDASTYLETRRQSLLPVVLEAFADLRRRYDVVICEGAGSPAEINLLAGDITNLGLADAAGVPALLVGDIERGGVFAAIAGTFSILPEHLAAHLSAFAINKLRGDASLLGTGIADLEAVTGRPCAGILPYSDGLALDAEDSLGLPAILRASQQHIAGPDVLDVAVIALPRLANFTDLDALALEPGVVLRLVDHADALGDPDLVILPGSKTTLDDLAWLVESSLGKEIDHAATRDGGPVVLGICAGYQMLGDEITDDFESRRGTVRALGLLPVSTTFTPEKLTRPRTGTALTHGVSAYEIHQGRPRPAAGASPLVRLADGFGDEDEGAVAASGRIVGTSLHGLFESDGFRDAFLADVARRRGKPWRPSGVRHGAEREAQIDRIADLVEEHLDLDLICSLIASASEVPA